MILMLAEPIRGAEAELDRTEPTVRPYRHAKKQKHNKPTTNESRTNKHDNSKGTNRDANYF